MSTNNILVVYKKSIFELYNSSTDEKVREYCNDPGVIKSHKRQKQSLDKVVSKLGGINHNVIYRADLKSTENYDLVVSVGGDGTFLEVSHYVKDIPILGVNSDPETSVGYFCSCYADDFTLDMPETKLNRLEIILDDKKASEQVLNDILIAHINPAATTRYELDEKEYKNSGLLVCTGAGSTAWMYQENGKTMELDSDKIQYITRGERNSQPCFADELKIKSLTRQGKLYIDGPHLTYDFGLGSELYIKQGIPLNVLGNLEEKRKTFKS